MHALPPDWEYASVSQLCTLLEIAKPKVHNWIKSGLLPASNVAAVGTTRQVFRIARQDFENFWQARKITAVAPRRNRPSSALKSSTSAG